MRKLILPFLALLFLMGCEKESTTVQAEEAVYENGSATTRAPKPKIDVCHYDADNDTWEVISVNQNAVAAHQGHGDAVDMDGDGFFDIANGCSDTDCDDTNEAIYPGAEDIPCNGIDENCDVEDSEFELQRWYLINDADADEFYVVTETFDGTCPPEGYIDLEEANTYSYDCNDTDPNINPGATEICDAIDWNCEGSPVDLSANAAFDGNIFTAGRASNFGSHFAGSWTGDAVDADDIFACEAIQNDLTGKIALINRGSNNGAACYFQSKTLNAEAAGAIAVIICNYDYTTGILNMAGVGTLDDPQIPAIFLSYDDCQTIRSNENPIVTVNLETSCQDASGFGTNNDPKNNKHLHVPGLPLENKILNIQN